MGLCLPRAWADPGDVSPAQPVIPQQTFKLTDFGAVADGTTPATEAFRTAIAAVQQAGGGTLIVPAGTYLTGPFDLCSKLELRLEKGAKVKFSQNPADYEQADGTYRQLFRAVNCDDLLISGEGVFDGQGKPWWIKAEKFKQDARAAGAKSDTLPRPRMFSMESCHRVRVENVTLSNSPQFHCIFTRCEDVTFEGVKISSPENSVNTDGIDPSVSSRVLISHCTIDTGDDNIAIKSGVKGSAGVHDVLITDCVFKNGHGCSIGSETIAGIDNVTVRRCTFEGTDAGVRLKSERGKGGLVQNLVYSDLTMRQVKMPIEITSYYHGLPKSGQHDNTPPEQRESPPPAWRNITIRNLKAIGSLKSAGTIIGLPESLAENITLENVSIDAPAGLRISYARHVQFKNVHLTADKGKNLIIDDTVLDSNLE